jgi:hypothetical protein
MKKLIVILTLICSTAYGQNTVFNGTSKNSMLLQGKDTTYLKAASNYWDRTTGKLRPKQQNDTVQSKMNLTELEKVNVGTKIVTVSPDSAVRLHGDATTWDDLFFPFTLGVSGQAGYPTYVVDSAYYSFVVDTTGPSKCIMYFEAQMPHRWKEGTDIDVHLHYKHTTTQGTPTFVVKYRWASIGSVFGAYSWVRLTTTTGTTNNTHQLVSGQHITGTSKGISSILHIQVYLLSSTGNNTCNAYQMDIHYQIDSMGSNTETSKN